MASSTPTCWMKNAPAKVSRDVHAVKAATSARFRPPRRDLEGFPECGGGPPGENRCRLTGCDQGRQGDGGGNRLGHAPGRRRCQAGGQGVHHDPRQGIRAGDVSRGPRAPVGRERRHAREAAREQEREGQPHQCVGAQEAGGRAGRGDQAAGGQRQCGPCPQQGAHGQPVGLCADHDGGDDETTAAMERAWATVDTGAPRSLPMATIVGARTTSSDCEAIVARTRGESIRHGWASTPPTVPPEL